MDKRAGSSFSVPGGSALMVIFAVLCLTVFAILSLSTVLADGRLAEASMDAVTEYYYADCRAEETLSLLRQGELLQGITAEGGVYSYEIPVSDTQSLAVSVTLDGGSYSVLRWQLEYSARWQADEGVKVWSGEGDISYD